MKSKLGFIVVLLLVIGGLNWGLVGLFDFDLVAALFGKMTMASKAIYVLVGIAGVMKLICMFKCCSSAKCNSGSSCDRENDSRR